MKNYFLLPALLILIGFTSISCKKEKPANAKYSIETKTTTINWTGYKTTEKIPVPGTFKVLNITKSNTGENPNTVFNGLEFSIPVNSIDSKSAERDAKIVTSFFGKMTDTKTINGKINLGEKGKGSIDLTLNGITAKLPMTYIISGQLAEFNATLDLSNWKAKLAIDALNKVCREKHKGKDGISKTWNEVAIHVVSYLKVE
ncbi:MAG: YceI family protein [Flavobacteriaceae bacterium]